MDFDTTFSGYGTETDMVVNDLHCTLHMPQALKSKTQYEVLLTLNEGKQEKVRIHGAVRKFPTRESAEAIAAEMNTLPQYGKVEVVEAEEEAQGLPPCAPRKAFKVDEYDCPTHWMHGSGMASSYFVPVQSDRGMWLDFNLNSRHAKQVAILLSIQGVNPLDGQSMVEIDQKISLKQYKEKCPKHDVEFQQDRYCPSCNYKWVPQNYLATTGTPQGYFWLDGFLAADGKVRQYYFTEKEELGVAHQIIGAAKKVYSIGIAFYLSKEDKPKPPQVSYRGITLLSVGGHSMNMDDHYGAKGGSVYDSLESFSVTCDSYPATTSWSNDSSGGNFKSRSIKRKSGISGSSQNNDEVMKRTLDIAAGAMINQKVYADPQNLDYWQDTPAGLIYINYCPAEQAMVIIERGKKDLTNKGEGFMGGLKVGK